MGASWVVSDLPRTRDEEAARLLARAFVDNPLDRAVIRKPPAPRLRALFWGMRSSLAAARQVDAVVLAGAEPGTRRPEGILLALPSSALPLPPLPLLTHLRATIGQGIRSSRRWGEVFRALEPQQPREEHAYLSLLGVEPKHQGAGLGSRLLSVWLEAVDRDRLPAYLETDREENLRFYRRQGFEVSADLVVLETPVWCMRRPPR